jgi:hypothetical protein
MTASASDGSGTTDSSQEFNIIAGKLSNEDNVNVWSKVVQSAAAAKTNNNLVSSAPVSAPIGAPVVKATPLKAAEVKSNTKHNCGNKKKNQK